MITHLLQPSRLYLFDGTDEFPKLQGTTSVDTATAPHECDMPGCPGPVNKRKLEAFDELLAAHEIYCQQARAAIAKARGHWWL